MTINLPLTIEESVAVLLALRFAVRSHAQQRDHCRVVADRLVQLMGQPDEPAGEKVAGATITGTGV